jgi:hypothetical protein
MEVILHIPDEIAAHLPWPAAICHAGLWSLSPLKN